jgi:hypothetical protein
VLIATFRFAGYRNDNARLLAGTVFEFGTGEREKISLAELTKARTISSWLFSWLSSWLSPWQLSSSYGLVRGRVYAGVDKIQESVIEASE